MKFPTFSKSLSCIQIGEIFNDTFNPYVNDIPKSGGNKPGFIIETPISAKVKECLSKILYLPCVIIYTFDFTCDFATMFEAGINIKSLEVVQKIGSLNLLSFKNSVVLEKSSDNVKYIVLLNF